MVGQVLGAKRTCIAVRSMRGLKLVPVRDVRCFLADRKYVTIHYGNGQIIARESLCRLEAEFGGRFLRVHRSALVAVKFIAGLVLLEPRCYELQVAGLSERLPVSRRRAPAVRLAMLGRAQQGAAQIQQGASPAAVPGALTRPLEGTDHRPPRPVEVSRPSGRRLGAQRA